MTRSNLSEQDRNRLNHEIGLRKWATYASVATAVILIGAKLVAYLKTGSVSLLSSLIDSIIDAFSSIVMMVGVHHATQPADREHRFGHGKFEALAAIAQAVFITVSALFLVYESLKRFVHVQEIHHPALGIGVMVFSIILTLVLVGFQYYVIRKTDSVAIAADSLHYKGDLLINLAVIAAIVLTQQTTWQYYDPLFALMIAMVLLHGAWKIGQQSVDILVDKELPDSDRQEIAEIVRASGQVHNLHGLRTRSSGMNLFIEFYLEIDGSKSVAAAHDITRDVESRLHRTFPNAEVIIHIMPHNLEESRPDHGGP